MVKIVKVRAKHLLIILLLALCAFSILLWPSKSSRIRYWQDKLFSPGSISLAHQRDAEGSKMICQSCHLPGKAITNDTCRECHDRKYFIKNQLILADSHKIFDEKDYCLRCHGEHNGYYMDLKYTGSTIKDHKAMPVKTDKCVDCHLIRGKLVHPSSTNTDCAECHEDYDWASEFDHKKFLSKAASVQELFRLCQDCHDKGHHYTLDTRSREGCVFCHEYWLKRRKNRPVPFPEKFFKDIDIDPKSYGNPTEFKL